MATPPPPDSSHVHIMKRRSGFTLVELLATVAIVGLLIGLLLPAIQSARESARRLSCANNLKQLALACLSYVESQGHFPSGGWGFQWTGDADAGLGQTQPGGWSYHVLPFLEQNPTFMMGMDSVVPRTEPTFVRGNSTAQLNGARDRGAVPVAAFICPTRRGVNALPCTSGGYQNMASITVSAGIDYAGSGGTASAQDSFSGTNAGSNGYPLLATLTTNATGVIYGCSRVTPAHVRDGLSVTFLLGEYNRNPDAYSSAIASIYGGGSLVVSLNSLQPDTPGLDSTGGFGAAHVESCHFAFCDGAVRPVRYGIAATVRGQLCNRRDRAPLNLDDL
jgi:prepilin-type N-terminal cleavage/methylation domain-containing protein